MITFNVICAAVFVLAWLALFIKGTSFMALEWWKRSLVALAFAIFMIFWIVTDHILLGR